MTTAQTEFVFESGATFSPSSMTGTVRERFEAFHAANPHVYRALKILALRMHSRGFKRIGISMLFEMARWEWSLVTSDVDGWKLNNSHRAYYARLLADRVPELADVFEMRVLRSERGAAA